MSSHCNFNHVYPPPHTHSTGWRFDFRHNVAIDSNGFGVCLDATFVKFGIGCNGVSSGRRFSSWICRVGRWSLIGLTSCFLICMSLF